MEANYMFIAGKSKFLCWLIRHNWEYDSLRSQTLLTYCLKCKRCGATKRYWSGAWERA